MQFAHVSESECFTRLASGMSYMSCLTHASAWDTLCNLCCIESSSEQYVILSVQHFFGQNYLAGFIALTPLARLATFPLACRKPRVSRLVMSWPYTHANSQNSTV